MNDVMNEQKADGDAGLGPEPRPALPNIGLPVSAEGDEPEPPELSAPRAWIVALRGLGLMNIVGTSQAELAERFMYADNKVLLRVEVLAHSSDTPMSTVWVNPGLVQAVLNEFTTPEPAPVWKPPVMQAVVVEEPRDG